MAIKSHTFGRVTLTQDDAAKFARQAKYGRANAAAKSTAERGSALSKKLKTGELVRVTLVRKESVAS